MKALTVRQPWAWAIVRGFKRVENRPKTTHHRGLLLIHAGQHLASLDAIRLVEDLAPDPIPMLGGPGAPTEVAFGAIIGAVAVVGAHPAAACEGRCSPWAFYIGHHWELEDARVFSRPIPAIGRLYPWDVEDDVAQVVKRELGA